MAGLEQRGVNIRRNTFSNQQNKKSTRVDLTPMVDLGFLLITFFIVATSLAQPKVMKIFLPATGNPMLVAETGSLTIIPLGGNNIFYYEGALLNAQLSHKMGIVDFSLRSGIGNIIRQKQAALDRNPKFVGGRKDLVVMIKPTAVTNYQNIISSLDEMTINDVKKFALIEISDDEKKLLKEMKIDQ